MRMLASHHSIILYKLPSFYIYFNLAQSNMDFGSLSFVTWFHSICVHSAWICVPKMQSLSLFPSAYHMYVVHCDERQPTNPISLQRIYKQFHAHCTHTHTTDTLRKCGKSGWSCKKLYRILTLRSKSILSYIVNTSTF